MDGYKEMGIISSEMYPGWFDSPEGKEGGNAFVEKRPAKFWPLRKQAADALQGLADEYEAGQDG